MRDRTRRGCWLAIAVGVVFAAGGPTVAGGWAARAGARPQAAPAREVPRLNPDALRTVLRLGADVPVSAALDKGATYNGLEGQATRVETTFDDAVAVNERRADGGIRTRMTDRLGNDLGTFVATRDAAAGTWLEFRAPGAPLVRAPGRAELAPTLDWAARQAYAFVKDGVNQAAGVPGSSVRWRRNLVRPDRAGLADIDAHIVEVRTEFAGGLTAIARRPASRAAARAKSGAIISFSSVLLRDGVEIGWVRWHQNTRVLAWHFPGGTTGYLTPGRLGEIGGWPFTPDMAWVNMQAFAFYELPRRQPPPGVRLDQRPGLVERVVQAIVPTLQAQDGCTGLHWLDGTIFRACCDQHDNCYNTYGCNRYSWFWPWGQAWQCVSCNMSAVFCFETIGGGDGTGPYI
ncbi:MAG: hypothetical protein AB7H88_15975 [Vicinamibacterales bacterium]